MTTPSTDTISLQQLLGRGYNPKQLAFVMAPEFEVCWVGGMGAGKSYAACCAVLRHMARFPGSKVLIARNTEEELYRNPKPLFFEIVESKGLRKHFARPKVWHYKERSNFVQMTNGSELTFGSLYGAAGESAIHRYKNVEYTLVFIDQIEQIEWEMYQLLLNRCRYSAVPPEERHVLSAAQDEGDNWIRRRFLTYEAPHTRSGDPLAQRRLIRGGSLENPHLDAGARAQLLALPISVQESWVHATMSAGASRLVPELETVEPFDVPLHWPAWVGIDPARSSGVTYAGWLTVNPDKESYKGVRPNAPHFFQEYWSEGRDAELHAEAILALSAPRRIQRYVMDRSAWSETIRSRGTGALNIAGLYLKAGLGVTPSMGDEWTRIELFTSAAKRGLTVSSKCENLLRQAPDYRIKGQEIRTGTTASTIKNKHRFHSIDGGGYALSAVPTRVAPLDLHGPQPMFPIAANIDAESRAHWTHVLSQLPRSTARGESASTPAIDEMEFHANELERDVEGDLRPDEDLQW